MITQTIDLNMIPNSPPVIVHVDQYDHGAGRIIANLYNGDQLYTPSNATAWIQGTKPDGRGFQYSATLSGSTVTAELTEQMTAVAGNVRTQIVVFEGERRTGTFCFTLAVQKSGLPADTDMSQSEYQIVEELIEEVIGAAGHAPIIGQNGNWWIWDVTADDYVDSGVDASITVRIADITMMASDATPYVTNTGTNTDPIFHLFIPRGTKGDTGKAAGFGTPTATIDGSTGTPSVQVTASGSDTAKVFDFAFHNLKGADGRDGAGATVYRDGGIIVTQPMPEIVTWAGGTDAEIAAMLDAHYAGLIDIHNYWHVGDERVVHLSAMEAVGVDESHVAQDVKMVLMSAGGKTLVTPINGHTECAFIVGQKNVLADRQTSEGGNVIASHSSVAGGWNACPRRTWCNSIYKNAFPSTLVGIFKEHQNTTANGLGSTAIISNDYFALASEKEVFGTTTYANATAEANNTQFKYYETSSNRIKYQGEAGGLAGSWWERSPNDDSSYNFIYCEVNSAGSAEAVGGQSLLGIAPFGVI